MKIRGNTIGTTMKPEKTVVKCENLTEEEKAIARANIGAASEEVIGMIDAALNTIIDQQKSFIGTNSDIPTITFYVHTSVYTAEENMTFEQWIGSKYNREEFYVGPSGFVYDRAGRIIYTSDDESSYVTASDKIIPEYRYIIRLN